MTKYRTVTCFKCEKEFQRSNGQFYKKRKYIFCSQQCKIQFFTTKVTKPCGFCEKDVTRSLKEYNSSKSGKIFCNKSCAASYNNTHKTYGIRRSKLEIWLEDQLRIKYPDLDIHCNKTDTINLELDFLFPKLNFAFEINGIFHYKPIYGQEKLNKTQNIDKEKLFLCSKIGIQLHVIDISIYTDNNVLLNHLKSIIDNQISIYKEKNINFISNDPTRGKINSVIQETTIESKKEETNEAVSKLLEKAIYIQKEMSRTGLNQTDLAKRENCSKAEICCLLRLLYLPDDIKQDLLKRTYKYISINELVRLSKHYKSESLKEKL